MGNLKYLIFSLTLATFVVGCQWDPPRSNPLDPEYYRYNPTGTLNLTIRSLDSHQPIPNAEVRIQNLNAFVLTDSSGLASFASIPVDTYWVAAARSGDFPFKLDSIRIVVRENRVVSDTLSLEALPSAFGSITLRVLTLGQQPISDATVLTSELGRFSLSDASGKAHFSDLPPGPIWLRAYREIQGEAIYGRDSIEVTVMSAASLDTFINLDALPSFTGATVNSVAFAVTNEDDNPIYGIRLQASVYDPDGSFDLDNVIAKFVDNRHADSLQVDLSYSFDSTYWWANIPSDSFYNGTINNVPSLPFKFQAFDNSGYSSPITEAVLVRVIHGFPIIIGNPPPVPSPVLNWDYQEFNELGGDTTLYNYVVRIYRVLLEQDLIYAKTIAPVNFSSNSHQVEIALPPGTYRWEVWVRDIFGNSSRSPRVQFNN